MRFSVDKLGNLLLDKQIITEDQFRQAMEQTGSQSNRFQDYVLDHNWMSQNDFLNVVGELYNIPTVKIDAYLIDRSIINSIPLSMARRFKVIPIVKMGDELAVAMADPLDVFAIDTIQYHTGCKLHISIADEKEISKAIDRFYSLKDSMDQVIEGMNEIDTNTIETSQGIEITEDSDESSVIKLVNLIILQALRDKASDIHFEPDENQFRVRFRIDGILQEVFTPPKSLQSMITSRLKIMADMDVSERRIPQDGRFTLRVDQNEVDFRASILPTVAGEKTVLRILDKTKSLVKLEDAGFSDAIFDTWMKVIKKTEGIILITGPTGSGKTTTLYSVLNELNSIEKNLVTVENPVEFQFPYINQVQVNVKAGMTFASGLRSILRQDPDIIMLGEIRDRETADIAIRSALTGHLVLSTLHTNDAPTAIARLTEMGLEPFLVESSLIAVLAQRLVRRICPHCKIRSQIDDATLKNLQVPGWLSIREIYTGEGCAECNYTGYQGRAAIHELLVVNDQIRKLIIQESASDTIRQAALASGMRSLRDDGLSKVAEGITTIEEVLRVSYN
ncbi:Flp pilus assembly complex ATPase component TadA [candidate division KSB1 bacterium]|nr:Flp pilus assembly complex ATPase component TadA [candidate division KSB1 bacterium]